MAAKYILAIVAVAILVASVTCGSKRGAPGGADSNVSAGRDDLRRCSIRVEWRQMAIDSTTSCTCEPEGLTIA